MAFEYWKFVPEEWATHSQSTDKILKDSFKHNYDNGFYEAEGPTSACRHTHDYCILRVRTTSARVNARPCERARDGDNATRTHR